MYVHGGGLGAGLGVTFVRFELMIWLSVVIAGGSGQGGGPLPESKSTPRTAVSPKVRAATSRTAAAVLEEMQQRRYPAASTETKPTMLPS